MSTTKLALTFRIFQHGQFVREERLTQGVIKIGKVPSAHLRIDDESVSRMHAVLEVSQGVASLIDLGSTRGTFVNGKKINKATLQSGDAIQLGDVRLELAIGDAADAAPVAMPKAPRGSIVQSLAAEAPAFAAPRAGVRPPPVPAARITSERTASVAGVIARDVEPVIDTSALPFSNASPDPVPDTFAAATPANGSSRMRTPSATPAPPLAAPMFASVPATSPDELDSGAVEVAALLGDSVIHVKHCLDPRAGKIRSATWALLGAGALCLALAIASFIVSVHTAASDAADFATWTRVQHRPAYAFRYHQRGPADDWLTFASAGLGVLGLGLGLWRARRERVSPYYRIGTAPGVELPVEHAPLPAFPLVAPDGDDFVFHCADGITGEAILDGKTTPLDALATRASHVANARAYPIPPRAKIRARVGQTTFMISSVARPRRHAAPLLAHLEGRALRYVAGSLAAHLAILALLRTIPPETTQSVIDLPTDETTSMRLTNIASSEANPPPPDDATGDTGGDGNPNPTAAMALPEGAAGNPHATDVNRMQVAQRDNRPRMSQDEAVQIAARAGILGSDQLLSGVRVLGATSDFASGFDDLDMNGSLAGALGGEGIGSFGGGRRGNGPGGGCLGGPCGTIGTGGYRIGLDPRGGGYGLPQNFGLRPRSHVASVPVVGQPVIGNPTYDKSIVRRYIRRHLNEISYCYEKQLLAHPSLGGDIKITFFITPQGSVQSASGQGFDAEVTSCLAGVIKSIEFPAPGDGGGVQVNYPFHFRAPNT